MNKDTPDQPAPPYKIRLASSADFSDLSCIEADAARRFADFGLAVLQDSPPLPASFYAALPDDAAIFVATAPTPHLDQIVGFAVLLHQDGGGYLRELSVHTAHGGHGIGRALVGAVCDWARRAGWPHVTLTSFRAIPFNGPFYEKLGFTLFTPTPDRWPQLCAIREKESELDALHPRGAWRLNL